VHTAETVKHFPELQITVSLVFVFFLLHSAPSSLLNRFRVEKQPTPHHKNGCEVV
jgi:hypothetical protein